MLQTVTGSYVRFRLFREAGVRKFIISGSRIVFLKSPPADKTLRTTARSYFEILKVDGSFPPFIISTTDSWLQMRGIESVATSDGIAFGTPISAQTYLFATRG